MSGSLPDVDREGPANTIDLRQDRETVFKVLTDPATYPDWLVGAHAIRAVDPGWPEPGTAFHHTVGAGPIKVSDRTTSLAVDEPEKLELLVSARPFIKARVTFELSPLAEGGTRIEMHEKPTEGIAGKIWSLLPGKRAVAATIWGRNAMSLDSLRSYLEQGGRGDGKGNRAPDHPHD